MTHPFHVQAEPFEFSYEFGDYDSRLLENKAEFESEFVSSSADPVPAGEQYLDTSKLPGNPLSGHGGSGHNLALRWNAVPRAASEIDLVVHLHGYINIPPNIDKLVAQPPTSGTLRALVARSGLDLSRRARPTVAIVPRGRRITADEFKAEQARLDQLPPKPGESPKKARSDRFTFPALLRADGAGLESLLAFALDWFARNVLGRSDDHSLRVGRLILTAHSGGGSPLNTLLGQHARRRACNPDQVQLFDALYGPARGIQSWVVARLAQERAGQTGLGGGLRVLHRAGTQLYSCQLAAVLPPPGDQLHARYRVERTAVEHNGIPAKFGGALLRDSAAEFGLHSACAGGSGKSPAPRPSGLAGSMAQSAAPQLSLSALIQELQAALASGQWYTALGLAALTGVRDENKLSSMLFFARHPERGGRTLQKGESDFGRLSREWLDIRDRIVRPFLLKSPPADSPTAPLAGPPLAGTPYPDVNTPLPVSGAGFVLRKRQKTDQRLRAYGLPEIIQALQQVAAEWHRLHPGGPRIVISDISPPGGSVGRFDPHSSHRIGLDIDLGLEGGRLVWYSRDRNRQWQKNSTYSPQLTAELARLFSTHSKSARVKFILFDDPAIKAQVGSLIKKDDSSPHRDHFHVRYCAPTYFVPKLSKQYQDRYKCT